MSPKQALLDIHEIHDVAHLRVASSSLDSASSTGTARSLTSSLHDLRSSLGSAHCSPTVKFAPLPQIDPNRKRSLAPLGASARSRRKSVIQQEGGSLLWSADRDAPEEDLEDPVVVFARFVKRASKTLWRRMRQSSKAILQENLSISAEPVLDISPIDHSDMAPEKAQPVSEVMGEDKRGRRASWSPPAERRTLSQDKGGRRNTSDMSLHAVIG